MSKDQGRGARRSSHVEMPVAYAAVGASRAPDLLRFPPEGSTPYEETLRLGSGQERFLLASSVLMTWGAQRGSGVRVEDVVRGSGELYAGVSFDEDGTPQAAGELEEHFGPDGEPYLVPGTTAVLHAPGQEPRSVLVVYTVDEERRAGFAWGTRDEAGAVGEQLFVIEHRDDDTVWAVARGFLSAPKSGLLGLRARADLRAAIDAVKAQLAALAPGATGATVALAAGGGAGEPGERGEPGETDEPGEPGEPEDPGERDAGAVGTDATSTAGTGATSTDGTDAGDDAEHSS